MVKLDHVALIVSSEECLKFYEKLGFKEIKRVERGYDTVVILGNGQIALEVFIDPRHPDISNALEPKGIRHIAFMVEDLEDLIGIVECGEIKKDWFGRRFTLTEDSDGQPIELIEKSEYDK